jgi:hypothetical protein
MDEYATPTSTGPVVGRQVTVKSWFTVVPLYTWKPVALGGTVSVAVTVKL